MAEAEHEAEEAAKLAVEEAAELAVEDTDAAGGAAKGGDKRMAVADSLTTKHLVARPRPVRPVACPQGKIKAEGGEGGGGALAASRPRGSQLCPHNKAKRRSFYAAPDSRPAAITSCEPALSCDLTRRTVAACRCRECGGSDFCQHDRRKGQCKECGGSQICEHNRQKFRCKEWSEDQPRICLCACPPISGPLTQ